MAYFPLTPYVLIFDFGPIHVGAVGPLAIIVVAIIVGAYFIGRGLASVA
jgi:hypothetical protein